MVTVPGLPTRDCAVCPNNCVPRRAKLSATDVTGFFYIHPHQQRVANLWGEAFLRCPKGGFWPDDI